jgi:tetratricopeptide (TPR) repeat protein
LGVNLTATTAQPLEIRKSLGKSHLQVDRIAEALEVYTGILQDYPEDLETYLVLGDCYLASGDAASAISLYQQAQRLNPSEPTLKSRLSLAELERRECAEKPITYPEDPADPAALARLLERLREDCQKISAAELARAVKLLQQVTKNPYPANVIATHLDEIAALLPAFIELNIRQAHADGRPDIAKALQSVAETIPEPIEPNDASLVSETPQPDPSSSLESGNHQPGRLLLVAPPSLLESPRLTLPAEALASRGWAVTCSAEIPGDTPEKHDVVVAHRPHGAPGLLEGMAACVGAGIPLVVDLDTDFEQMPHNHPEYPYFGLGTSAASKAYAAALQMADRVVVPSESLAQGFEQSGIPANTVPDGWSRSNTLWEKPADRRTTVNLGWFGMSGQIDDVLEIRRPLMRILREFPHTRLVIGIDPQVYQLFDNLPESQKLFLPPTSHEDYPYLLSQIDILLVPLRNTPFNRTMSDRRLMEAGVRGIPWLAAPTPGHTAWGAGGLIANTRHDWHVYLRQLVLDPELRHELGQAGRQRAAGREQSRLGALWDRILGELLQSKVANHTHLTTHQSAEKSENKLSSPIINAPVAAPSQP